MHTHNLEQIIKISSQTLQWQDGSHPTRRIHDLLDHLTKEGSRLSRVQKLWTTPNWICEKTGYDKPNDRPDVQAAYEYATTQVTKTLYQATRKSTMCTDECVKALERALRTKTTPQHTATTAQCFACNSASAGGT